MKEIRRFRIFFLVILAYYCFAFKYSVLIDSGSTGSRIYIYNYLEESPIATLQEVAHKRTRPALSTFYGDAEGLQEQIKDLISFAESTIPAELFASTPIALKATAGLRIIPTHHADWLIDRVREVLGNSSFSFNPLETKVITGGEEALFGLLATNIAFANLSHAAGLTLAAGDLGGSSQQIAFMLPPQKFSLKVFGQNIPFVDLSLDWLWGTKNSHPPECTADFRLVLPDSENYVDIFARSIPGLGLVESMQTVIRRMIRSPAKDGTLGENNHTVSALALANALVEENIEVVEDGDSEEKAIQALVGEVEEPRSLLTSPVQAAAKAVSKGKGGISSSANVPTDTSNKKEQSANAMKQSSNDMLFTAYIGLDGWQFATLGDEFSNSQAEESESNIDDDADNSSDGAGSDSSVDNGYGTYYAPESPVIYNPCVAPGERYPYAEDISNHSWVGTGNFDQCLMLVKEFLHQKASREISCVKKSKVPTIIAMDNFPKVLEVLKLADDKPVAPIAIKGAGRAICQRPWPEVLAEFPGFMAFRAHQACFGAAYIYAITTELYNLKDDDLTSFLPTDTHLSYSVGWPLGATVFSFMNWKYEEMHSREYDSY